MIERRDAAVRDPPQVRAQGQKSQLAERVLQLEEEISGLSAQVASKDKQIDWIEKELEGVRELWSKQPRPVQPRDRAGARAGASRRRAWTAGRRDGAGQGQDLGSPNPDAPDRPGACAPRSARTCAKSSGKMAELVERKVAAEDQLKRIDIRAPQDGMVHQLDVHTVGGVVTAGDSDHAGRAGGRQADRGSQGAVRRTSTRLRVGQKAVLRFSNFNQPHDTRNQRRGHGGVRRRHHRSAHGSELLHGAHCRIAGGDRAT